MSEIRQFLVRSLATRYSPGGRLEAHSHSWPQLLYALDGVMTVETAGGAWVVPSQRAVWIPAGVDHSVEMSGQVFMRTLYLSPALETPLPARCGVVQVSRLLRELILHTVELGLLAADDAHHRHVCDLLLDQLVTVTSVPLELPMPRDSRALRVAERVRTHLAERKSMDVLAREAGASRRTLERRFQGETGMTFGRWRQQARLLQALRLLAAGEPVTRVAFDVGYDSPSAFIAMFRAALGTTPARYYATE